MNLNEEVRFYMCGVDWQYELGKAADGTILYPSVNSLKKYRSCWKECGIVEITINVSQLKWIEPQDFSKIGK